MTTYDDRASLTDLTTTAERVRRSVERVIEGKPEVVRLSLTVLLAEGHLLIEDVPGVGKTMLAKALARSIDCSVRRIQFTPDLLPSDITGVSIFDQQRREFEFKPGAIFAQIVIGDEINRASPKTQSALLESMEERQVTIDGHTYELPDPFMVVATQNPVEMEGTYPLPEAQRDRFMARVSIGYPSPEAELQMLDVHGGLSPLDDLQPVAHAHDIVKLIDAVRTVHVADAVRRYAVELVAATRSHPDLRLGASPRATLHLLRAAKASAALSGRDYALPDDVQALATPVLAHRLLPTAQAQLNRRTAEQVVLEIIQRTPVPTSAGGTAPPVQHQGLSRCTTSSPGPGSRDGGLKRARRRGGRRPEGRPPRGPGRTDHPGALVPGRNTGRRRLRVRPRPERSAAGGAAARRAAPGLCHRALPHPLPGHRHPAALAVPGVGAEARVHLRMENVSRLPTGLLMLQDRVPYVLGPRPRFVLDRVEAAKPPRGVLPGPLRPAGPLSAGPVAATARRPVRDVRADPLVQRVRHPRRHPADRAAARVAAGGRGVRVRRRTAALARTGSTRTTSFRAATGTATICAGSTGAPPHATAS